MHRLAKCACAIVLLGSPALADDEPLRIKGQKIDSTHFGPSIIEPMSAAVARDQARSPGEMLNPKARNGAHGQWVIPSRGATCRPCSGDHYAINKWGDTRMGIGFGGPVDLHGAYIGGQAGSGVWTTALRVIGYRDGQEVGDTGWYSQIGETLEWFDMDLRGVDRVVFEGMPVVNGAGWFGMDDLTYTPQRPNGEQAETILVDFEDADYRQKLTGSSFAGLIWEEGTGDFEFTDVVHAPKSPPLAAELEQVGSGRQISGGNQNGTPPELQFEFQGVIRGDAGSFSFPPDTCGAVGPNHFVETVNRNFAVYDKETGQELVNILLGSFMPGSNGDPRVVFDQYSGRWIVIVTDFAATESIFLAVSTSSDPTGSWFKTSFETDVGSDASCWPDYPTLGVDEHGIYTTAYMVGCGMSIFAIDKAPLVHPIPSLGTITAFRGFDFEGAIQPVHSYGNPLGQYFVSRPSSNSLRVRRIDGPLDNPTLVTVGNAAVPSNGDAPNAPALGSVTPLNTIDARLISAVYRDGSIWTAHTIAVGERAACRWYEIDAEAAAVVQMGTISDSVLYYFFPGIMVNAAGDVIVGFSGSHAGQYAATYYTGRGASDIPGAMAPPILWHPGSAAQNNIDGSGRNRWGDYSWSTLDPNDELTLWTIQEYAHASDIWGTWVGKFTFDEPQLNFEYEGGLPEMLNPAGDSLTVTVSGINGGTPEPGTGLLHLDVGEGFETVIMNETSPNVYEGVFPAIDCGTVVQYFVSAQTTIGEVVNNPLSAPAITHQALVAVGLEDTFADNFEVDMGWTTEVLGATSGFWERGVPIDDPLWDYDPSSDGDGSGQCWLTENQNNPDYDDPSNTDVDDGAVRLTSPTLDMAGGGGISYYYFLRLTNGDGTDQLLVEINSADGVGSWVEIAGHDTDGALQWRFYEISRDELLALGIEMTSMMRVRFTANDGNPQSIVEAGVDGFSVTTLVCDDSPNPDLDGDGDVDAADLAQLLGSWGPAEPCPPFDPADLNQDCAVGASDLAILLGNWGQ